MPLRPEPRWTMVGSERVHLIDWVELFRGKLTFVGSNQPCGGEMRRFHVIFRLRITGSGTLVFFDDDGSIVRRNGEVVHVDRGAHPLRRHEIEVRTGDRLEIAQWQLCGEWKWGAMLVGKPPVFEDTVDVLQPFARAAAERMASPNGPPLKVYTHGRSMVRTAVAALSVVLNGYRPSEILLYGENDWPAEGRELVRRLMPWARVVREVDVISQIADGGSRRLTEWARRHWFVQKMCVAMFCQPREFCLIDDDIFILDSLDEMLAAFRDHDTVFVPDADYRVQYQATWLPSPDAPRMEQLGWFCAALYFARVRDDLRAMADAASRVDPAAVAAHYWEQGFIGSRFVGRPSLRMPPERYLFAVFDGFPGGLLGYDWRANPCRYASVHFGGLHHKPSDAESLLVARDLLGRALLKR